MATLFALGWLLGRVGAKWTLVIGALSWLALYLVYLGIPRPGPVIASQAFHGIAYVTFMIAGQVYAGQYAPKEIGGSVQALVFAATTGVGLFLGTLLAGWVMDRNRRDGKFRWRGIWMVPAGILLAGAIALAAGFRGALRG